MRKVSILVTAILILTTFFLGCKSNQEEASTEPKDENTASAAINDAKNELDLSGQLNAKILKIDRVELPENAVLKLELRRITDRATRRTETVASKSMPVSKLPVDVVFPYDTSTIERRESYLLDAAIREDEKLLYGADFETPVLTYGAGEQTQIILKPRNLLRDR